MTPKLIRCVATTDNGRSCRGKRVFRMRFALSSIDLDADCTDVAKKIQADEPDEQEERVVPAR